MKILLKLTAFILLLVSCNNSNKDEKLLGNWNSSNYSDHNELRLYKDSVIFYEYGGKFFGKWKSKNSVIYIQVIDPETDEIINDFNLEYKFNGDSLLIKRSYDSSFVYPPLFKVKNRFEHLQKMLDLKIDLPSSENPLKSSGESRFNMELFIGYHNGDLLAKIDDKFMAVDKKNIMGMAFGFLARQSENDFDKLKLVLIADKSVSNSEIDSIKYHIRKTPIKEIFRVFRNDTIDYRNINWRQNTNWYGLKE